MSTIPLITEALRGVSYDEIRFQLSISRLRQFAELNNIDISDIKQNQKRKLADRIYKWLHNN